MPIKNFVYILLQYEYLNDFTLSQYFILQNGFSSSGNWSSINLLTFALASKSVSSLSNNNDNLSNGEF